MVLKRPITIAQQHRNTPNITCVLVPVSRYEIKLAVAVKITCNQHFWSVECEECGPRLKGAVPITQKNRNGIVLCVRDGKIELAVAVEIKPNKGLRRISN